MHTRQELVDLLRTLGDPTRLRLLMLLRHGELTVGELTRITGLSQPRVSRHLRLLCEARVLQRARDQNEVYYRATIDEDRRDLAEQTIGCLPGDDPEMRQDLRRLDEILEVRQMRAREVLEDLGVQPLDADAMTEVGATVDELLANLSEAAAADDSVGELLDVGTGTGSMLRLLAPRAKRTVAVDRSHAMRLVARARASVEGLKNCTVQDGDMYSLNFPRETFDLVTMDRVLGTAEQPGEALKEAAQVLKADGHLLVIESPGSAEGERQLGAWVREAGLHPIEVSRSSHGAAVVALARRSRSTTEPVSHEH